MLVKSAVALALFAFQLSAQATDLPAYPFIHVSATAVANLPPDIGEISFAISAHDPEPDKARALVDERIAALRALFAQAQLDEGDIDIRDPSKEMRKPDAAQPGVVLYDIRCAVHLNVRELGKWGTVVSGLLDMPYLTDFMGAFDVTQREKIEAQLLADAMTMARRKAAALAAGMGRQLGPVGGVSNGELKNLTRAMGLAAATDYRGGGQSRAVWTREGLLSILPIRLAQPVDVIYRIK